MSSFHVIDKRIKGLKDWKRFIREFEEVLNIVKPDFIIDVEPHGLKSSILCLYAHLRHKIPTLGVAEIPFRKFFYSMSSPPSRKVLKTSDYTDRNYVVLKALVIDRNNIPITPSEKFPLS